ncbi:hypothetical protein [uncultured Parabacteroides sp.]|jgi:predicted outer membrane lipoprotein|uniref:hypothetical protein n=1 Tax=uncultured Parabacteroides sp. TaxID=512312 RepID=UPI0025F09482|nr:hypothetical protein [uncultured Parabacteroides sp.]
MMSATDRSISVPQWFGTFYDSVYFWGVVCTGFVLAAAFVVIGCRLWYEMKEAQRFLEEKEEADRVKKGVPE